MQYIAIKSFTSPYCGEVLKGQKVELPDPVSKKFLAAGVIELKDSKKNQKPKDNN